MAERWQSSEGRVAAVFFRDTDGSPKPGLTPSATSAYKDGTAGAPAVTVAEVSGGFYRLTFATAPTKDVLVKVDGGASLSTTRYVALEVPVGGYVDQLDAATSSRASASALATAQADITTLLGRLTSARAALLDNLSLLDAAISTRATHAEATGDTAGTTTILERLTTIRAALLDNLLLLDTDVSSRATGASVTALGSPAQATDWTATRAAKIDHLDADVTSRATHAEATADSAGVATLLIRLTDARALLLDHLDADVSSRATHADATGDTAGTGTLLARLTTARAAALDLLDLAISSRSSASEVAALGAPLQTADSRVAHLDADISSRASAASVAALGSPAQTSSLATVESDIIAIEGAIAAVTADIAGLGSPSQVPAVQTLADAVAALADTLGDPAQAASLTDAVTQLLAAINTPPTGTVS